MPADDIHIRATRASQDEQRRYTARDRDIAHGLKRLREAREWFKYADCPQTLKKIASAIKSGEGAARNAARFPLGRPARTRAARLARRTA